MERQNEQHWINRKGSEWEIVVNERRKIKRHGYDWQERNLEIHARKEDWVLDFGCAYGRMMRKIADKVDYIRGIDISKKMVDYAKDNYPIDIIKPLDPIPHPDDLFDLVYTSNVLIHIHPDDIHAILRELVRVVKPTGRIIHFETVAPETMEIENCMHGGSWFHPLEELYKKYGFRLTSQSYWDKAEFAEKYKTAKNGFFVFREML